jgi:hypothetical protein
MNTVEIDENLLKEYMTNFYGYGNLKGDYWFVGMEEGGGGSPTEIISRLNVWQSAGKPTLLDNYEFHKKVTGENGHSFEYLFKKEGSRYQPTWGGLIKILLNFKNGKKPTLGEVKLFQSEMFGRVDSNNCIVELFPLPSRSTIDFHYSTWTNIDYLKDRGKYKSHLEKMRIEKLKSLISDRKPKFVLFYGSSPEYVTYWSKISDVDFTNIEAKVIHKKLTAKFCQSDSTFYVITHHPASKNGMGDEYFKEVGKMIKNFIH